jgi:Chaperone of endosialidase
MSFFSKDEAPQPPNPIALAGAQTSTNVSTALANAFLNNTNQVTPLGSLSYDQTGTYSFTDPTTGSAYDIPRFTATQTLSPQQTAIQNQTQAAQANLAGMANTQSSKLSGLLANDINLSGASQFGDVNRLINQPGAQTTFGDAGNITRDYQTDDLQRGRVEDALFGRLNPQLQRERGNIEQRLADQGIRYGSQAYNNAMDDYNRQANDARLGVTAAGGQEQQLQANLANLRGTFQNAAQQQAYTQAAGRGQFANTAAGQNLQQQQAIVNAQNQQRNQYLTEQYALRSQPINEITSLLSGSQVSRPNFMTTPTNTIPTTDFAGLQNQNFSQNLDIYKQQNANQQALIGGGLGFAGALAKGGFFSDRRMKTDVHRIGTVFAADDETKLPIYRYAYKDDPASLKHIGPMAQDVEKVAPEAVKTAKSGPYRGMKYIKPERMMGAILKAA